MSRHVQACFLASTIFACAGGDASENAADAGESSVNDASSLIPDAGRADAAEVTIDAGLVDAGPVDASSPDAGGSARRNPCESHAPGQTYPPGAAGPFPVGVKTIELVDASRNGRKLTTEIWYPAVESARGQDGESYFLSTRDASMAAGIPGAQFIPAAQIFEVIKTTAVRDAPLGVVPGGGNLVVFSHGYRGIRYQSAFLMVRLASHGYVVAAPDHLGNTLVGPADSDDVIYANRLLDMLYVTKEMQRKGAAQGDFFNGAYPTSLVGWVGHSFGASTILSLSAREHFDQVIVPLAPRIDERMQEIHDPPSFQPGGAMMVVGGSLDKTCEFVANQQGVYDRTTAPRFLAKLEGAGHFDFTELCGNQIVRQIPQIKSECGADVGKYYEPINTLVTSALNRYLRCDPGGDAALAAAAGSAITNVSLYSADP